jgi:hypothetical protein
MQSDNLGSGADDVRRSLAVAAHVEAIQIILDATVLCLVVLDDTGELSTVCPDNAKFQVMDTLRHIDWSGEYDRMTAEQDSR